MNEQSNNQPSERTLPKTGAYFWIVDNEIRHEEITQLLRITPDRTIAKGDLLRSKRAATENFWEVRSSLASNTIFMDDHIRALTDQLLPHREDLRSLRARGCQMGINCFGYFANSPGFHLDHELIVTCAELGPSLDFDLYCITESDLL